MRAIRAQTFSLVSRDFVGLARLSARRADRSLCERIAPNMSSYSVSGLHPPFRWFHPRGRRASTFSARPGRWHVSRHHDDERRRLERAPAAHVVVVRPAGGRDHLRRWGLYLANVGLDEVFNPKLREL